MKLFLYLLLALPLLGIFAASCSDDDKDLPNVTLSMEYSGATYADGVFTVEQGDTLSIDALKVIPAEGTKEATLGPVTYYLDNLLLGTTPVEPFAIAIPTDNLPVGKYVLQASANIFQVGKSVGFGVFAYKINVIENQNTGDDDSGNNSGVVTPETKITEHE